MGRRGPAPTPTPILKLRGSWRGDYRPDGAIPPEMMVAPDPPEHLTPDARAAWDRLIPQLDALGILTEVDANSLARYCSLWVVWAALNLADPDDRKFSLGLAPLLLRLEAEFGMSPASRAHLEVKIRGAKESSPLEQLQREAKGG